MGLALARKPGRVPRWCWLLPTIWFVWQVAAAVWTIESSLTAAALKHFAGCLGCFLVGLLSLGRLKDARLFILGLLVGLVFTLVVGWHQHFWGLEEMRKHFSVYVLPKLNQVPPELLKRIESRRIFGTFVYSNALAGCVILLLPGLVTFCWRCCDRWAPLAGRAGAVCLGVAGAACLFWTGSKAGWLIAVLMVVVWSARWPIPRRMKVAMGLVVLTIGVAVFLWRFESYFAKGATSVGARFQYWAAAARAFNQSPVVGTGPGTFGAFYRKVKPPEAEMAQLAHNDYLEQASDSGLVGGVCYAAFWVGSLFVLGISWRADALGFAFWLGLLGWALQGLVEFGLYIPGMAWPAFTILGWLWCRIGNGLDMNVEGS